MVLGPSPRYLGRALPCHWRDNPPSTKMGDLLLAGLPGLSVGCATDLLDLYAFGIPGRQEALWIRLKG